jgi:hypothetical protein
MGIGIKSYWKNIVRFFHIVDLFLKLETNKVESKKMYNYKVIALDNTFPMV